MAISQKCAKCNATIDVRRVGSLCTACQVRKANAKKKHT